MRRIVAASVLMALVAFPVVADEANETKALLDKAIKAHGGADNLTKFKAATVKMKGKVEVAGMTIEYASTASVQQPDKLRVETEVEIMNKKFTVLQIVNGAKGWIKFGDKTMDLDKDQVAEMLEMLHAQRVATLAPLTDKAYKLSPLGEVKVDGKEAVGVLVAHKDRRDVSLYFDKKTSMLVKMETRSKDVQGGNNQEFTAETLYSEYKETGGVQRARKQILKRDGKDFGDAEVSEYQGFDKLDDELFAKP